MSDACPCCPGARSNDCTCAVPCGDPQCQAIDPFGGHEFAYESSTDLFRCAHCREYEVTVRGDDGSITECPGDVPGEPMVLNAW